MNNQSRVRAHAPEFQPGGLWNALGRLDRMLEAATAAFDGAATSEPVTTYQGPYALAGNAQQLIKQTAPEPVLALRLSWMQQVFGLDMIDLDIMLIALAPEVDLHYEQQFAHLQGWVTPRPPTVDLVLNLLCASRDAKIAARAQFSPDAPLLCQHLLQLNPESTMFRTPLLAQFLRLEESVVRFLLGQPWLDARLRPFAWVETTAVEAPGPAAEALANIMSRALDAGTGTHFYLEGPAGGDQDAALSCLAAKIRAPLLTVALGRAAEPAGEFAGVLELVLREARLLNAVLYFTGVDALPEQHLNAVAEMLQAGASGSVVAMAGAQRCGPRFRTMASLAVRPSSFHDRRKLWVTQLHSARIELAAGDIDELASRYRLSDAQIKDALISVERQAALQHERPGRDELAQAARQQTTRDPGPLARKLAPRHQWDDLVLPEAQIALLREVCGQARYRHVVFDDWGFDRKLSLGKGLSVLFSGPPGTGKTMAAEVIAHDLGLELFKIDLSQVVSKYIGETEKGLERLFSEACAGNAILFFDECDALFGKRTMVQDAHDRYANIEVAYLLQKLEEHEGLSIMATNLRPNLDVGFTRRLSFIIEFPFPDEHSRRRLWQTIWPAQLPRSQELDLDFMATQFKLSGGAVKNIALAAAFLAARNGAELRTEHLLWAARSEIEKSGQRVATADFGRYGSKVAALAAEGAA